MADKELRRMNRTELIEIIYALQQNERSLRAENEELRRQLDDKLLRMKNAGSIAEAALSLNRVFEDAEAAARQYMDSLRYVEENAEEILADARQRAAEIITNAQTEVDEIETECQEMREQAAQDIKRQRSAFAEEMGRFYGTTRKSPRR